MSTLEKYQLKLQLWQGRGDFGGEGEREGAGKVRNNEVKLM